MIRKLATLVLLAAPTSAIAADFSFVSTNGSWPNFTFDIETSPTPDAFDADGFNINGVGTLEETDFGAINYSADYRFYTTAAFGGFENGLVAYYSRVMFTGDTSAPIFHNGVYKLTDYSGGPTVGILTITNAAAALAVPEPATWALTMGGFGIVGFAARRRSQSAPVTLA